MTQFSKMISVLVTMMPYVSADLVTFYTEIQFKGEIHTVVDFRHQQCYNLPDEYHDRASSVSTQGSCIVVYSFSDCTGDKRRISPPETSELDILASISFDKNIRSFESCQRSDANSFTAGPTPSSTTETLRLISTPPIQTTRPRPSSNFEKRIAFYDKPDFDGKYFTIYFNSFNCYNLPGHWEDRTHSVNTHGNCVNLYELADCPEPGLMVSQDTEKLNNLQKIGFAKTIRSFRPCIIT